MLVSEASDTCFAIRESFEAVFREVKKMVADSGLEIDGSFVRLTICLGADLMFLLLVLGLQCAS